MSCSWEIAGLTLICAVTLGCLQAGASASDVGFHVSASGSDAGDGSAAKPFATLQRARHAVRDLKSHNRGNLPGPVEIVVEGEIELAKPLTLEKIDSGTRDCTITYTAAKGCRIAGGVRLRDFAPVTDPDVLSMMDESARGKVVQVDLRNAGVTNYAYVLSGGMELFFNDKPMTLSRWPNEGFVRIVDVLKNQPCDIRGTKGDRVGDIIYGGDRPSRWLNEKDPWVHGYWFWDWADQRQQIASIDTAQKVIHIKPPYHGYGYRKGQWYYAYNLLSEIDSPGEWYVDGQAGILYLWPPSDPKAARVVVSVAPTAIKADGISHVRFDGLLVEATREDAISITNSHHVLVSGCTVRNTGGYAINISGGDNCTVRDCEIYNQGKGGVVISGGDRKKLIAANHQVIGCNIHDYGRMVRMYSAGVHIGGVGNKVAHCAIHDAPHQAIGFGGNNHVMEYNEIYRVCTESNDAGAIYSGRDWSMLDNVVRYNYFHDITGFENKGCVGVYLDDFFSGTTIYGNVFKNVSRAAMVGGGNYNTTENNLFIDCKPCVHLDARGEGWAKDYFDGRDNTLMNRLMDVDYKSKYYAKYTWLSSIWTDPNPGHPRGNRCVRNVVIGGEWQYLEKAARPDNAFEANTVTTDQSLLTTNSRTGIPDLTSKAYRETGLKPIPTGKIGLGRPIPSVPQPE